MNDAVRFLSVWFVVVLSAAVVAQEPQTTDPPRGQQWFRATKPGKDSRALKLQDIQTQPGNEVEPEELGAPEEWRESLQRRRVSEAISLSLAAESLTRLRSQWHEYFGTHYASALDKEAGRSWNTVRGYGRPHVGPYAIETQDAPALRGPFVGKELQLTLGASPAPGGRTPEQMMREIIERKLTVICLMTNVVRPTLEPFDKDRAYWVVRLVHEKFPEAHRYLVWQIGNEVVSGHFDPMGLRQQRQIPQGATPDGKFFGYDLRWKEDYYVNRYLAPAVEAIELASRDVYGQPRKIKLALGSMNPYGPQNKVFLANVMARSFDGQHAPTLKDEPVWKHIDLLTVHYMTGSDENIGTLQEYHDKYLKEGNISGIWITEDHGRAGLGPVTILDRSMRYLAWVARNDLDAEQTRLCWWGERQIEPGGCGTEATNLLGEFLANRQLFFLRFEPSGVPIYLLTDSTDTSMSRILVAIVPGRRDDSLDAASLRLRLPEGAATRGWAAQFIQYSASAPAKTTVLALSAEGRELVVALNQRPSEPCLVLLESSDIGTGR